jgi:hypothetical protein
VTQIDLYPLFLLNKKRRERGEPLHHHPQTPKNMRSSISWKLMKIEIMMLSAGTVQGCILKRGAARSVLTARNATSGVMNSVRVPTTGKHLYAVFATPSKWYARLP